MPEANTSQILLEEILQKLQTSAPVSTDELLKMFLGDKELEQIRTNTLNRIRKISNDTLDFVVTSLQKELFNNPKRISEMADPLGFIELRKTYKDKSEKVLDDSLDNIKNELGKIKIDDLSLFEDLKKKIDAIELPENIKTIDVPIPAAAAAPQIIPSPTVENKLDDETKNVFSKIEKTLNKLNKSLKSVISKKPIEPAKNVIFSEKALNQLSRVTNIDRDLLEALKGKIESDPTKKTLTTVTKKTGLLGRTIYETGDPKVQLNEASLKDIFKSLDITNDQQEVILAALLDITKDTNKELKETKKGILESSFFKVLNGISDFLRDLLAIGTLFLGGGALITIAEMFGPEILNFIDKYFGTDLTKTFESITSKFKNFSDTVNTVQKWLYAFGAGLVTVSGLLLYGFSAAIKGVISSLGKLLFKPGAFATPKPARIPPTTKPPTTTPTGATLPPGARPAGASSYIGADGKAYSLKTGKPLTGAAARAALQAASKLPPSIPSVPPPSTGARAATTGSQWAKGVLGKGSFVLAAGIEAVNSYQSYQAYATRVDDALKAGEINESEASELKTKAKGRITGEATARTASGLIGAALTAGAVGAGIGAAGFGVGAIPGFLIGLGAGALGYYGGTKLSEASGLTELAGKAGEETVMFYNKQDKPDLKPAQEPPPVNVEEVKQTTQFPMQQMLEKYDQNQISMHDMLNNFNQNVSNMNQNLQGMGGMFNNININQGMGENKDITSFINSSRSTDPILDFRADWWNHLSKRGVY